MARITSRPCPLLFLDHAPALGGAEHALLLLFEHLDHSRWDSHLISPEGPMAVAAARLDIPVHLLSMPRLRRSPRFAVDVLSQARQIARIAHHIGASILVANTVRSAIYGSLAARLAGLPFVWYMHDFWLGERRPRHLWFDSLGKRLLCAAAIRVIANSHATAGHLPCAEKVRVVHNGVKVERYAANGKGSLFRSAHGIPPNVPVVGTVGRLRPWKGQDRFLRAMAFVADAVPNTWFLIVGGTPFQVWDDYPRRLHDLARRLGIAGRTVFTGHIAEVERALAAMDVFVHPGDPEPFGLVVVEAMSAGRPVVGFAHGALPEIVLDGKTGILVPPGDERALAEAVIRLLQRTEEACQMGVEGQKRAATLFTATRMAGEFEQVIVEILEQQT